MIGNQLRLRQVLINLIGNAVKFTEQGSVEVRVAAGGTTPDGKREVVFTISDSGIGIDKESQYALFDSFRQADDSHSRIYGGTGLGLTISREIVELMGGTIDVASEKGVGSTFIVIITFSEGQVEDVVEAAGPRESISLAELGPALENGCTARLLIAEDDPTNSQIFSHVFKLHKIESDSATNGIEAVEMWEQGNYDLIVMDVQMPRMDGFEATRAIRAKERERGGHTLILAMTGHASREDEQRCFNAGMDAFISKPVDLAKAIETVRKLVDSSRPA